jgi:hypothetical protein
MQTVALERTGVEFKVCQFPVVGILRIDGNAADWAIVPQDYTIGINQLKDKVNNTAPDKKDLDVKVTLGR